MFAIVVVQVKVVVANVGAIDIVFDIGVCFLSCFCLYLWLLTLFLLLVVVDAFYC